MSENTICIKTQEKILNNRNKSPSFSIIVPTFNESQNILDLIESIKTNINKSSYYEIIIVDDNSPDGTTNKIIDTFNEINGFTIYNIQERSDIPSYKNFLIYPSHNNFNFFIKIIIREGKTGLISAIQDGIKSSMSDYIIIMDADLSHSPTYLNILIKEIKTSKSDIVIASRYLKDGKILGWPKKRVFYSKAATFISKSLFKLNNITDPMSGFFIIKRDILNNIKFNTSGYKILLEILVKSKNIKSREIPYTFINRKNGSSKLSSKVIIDFFKALIILYNHN
ncbi:MAG: polyprenol monophosphomannose synthase [Thermoproteota archaeon]|nr:polyprenol monophosphomannose synthase [Thermoproteota archaeon]